MAQAVTTFDVARYTQAPLQLEGKASFDASPEAVFAMVSDHRNLKRWVPMLKTVAMDHSGSESSAACGVGSVRHCQLGGGVGGVDERILWWSPPQGYAFALSARNTMMMPIQNLVSIVLIEPNGHGGSFFIWRSYFNWRGLFMRHLAKIMLTLMMNAALRNLRAQLGGAGGKVRQMA